MKTNELIGPALNWAVTQAMGPAVMLQPYSTDWAQGGPIIEREKLCIGFQHQLDNMYVPTIDPDVICWARTTAGGYLKYGPTPLIAAMRCYVASKMGDSVDIPDALL